MEDGSVGSLNQKALFCDETEEFRIPAEPDTGEQVTLRFRTAKNDADAVFYIQEGKEEQQAMEKAFSDKMFDYYEYQIVVGEEPVSYWFRVVKGGDSCYYNRLGPVQEAQESFRFRITPGFHIPEWAKGAVIYQIFVDRFCNGDPDNDVESQEYVYIGRPVYREKDWFKNPSVMDVGRFYGGDLQGVWDKLDYIQDLGIEVLYFNPLFVSPSNHKYDTQDYDHIDPHYGKIVKDGGNLVEENATDNENATKYMIRSAAPDNLDASDRFFEEFMKEVHRRGMKVIIDGVLNHCGSFNKWLDREKIYEHSGEYQEGAYTSKDSPYHTFFKFWDDNGWPGNKSYDGWWGHDTLPKLNYEDSKKLQDYIMKIARKWVSPPYNVDGWRLDVAADLGHSSDYNHQFWKEFRKAVKEANPNALILAEHYGDPRQWLQGDEWDTIMNYDAFMEPLTWFLTGMEKHSDEYIDQLYGNGDQFFRSMFKNMSHMQNQSVLTSMNELSNHDHSRFMTRTNRKVGRIGTVGAEAASEGIRPSVFREAVLVQMTWPGAPTVYYGDEAGVCGWTDPDNRRTYPWGREDKELIRFHKDMIRLHKENKALRRGSLKQLLAGNHVIAYGRFFGENRCVVAVNNSDSFQELSIPVWEIGITDEEKVTQVMMTTLEGYTIEETEILVENGILKIGLGETSGVLLISNDICQIPEIFS
ncbi:MAG: glycoside hydrolase family 13 protein [Hungatella sp.]|nr:glycoside hydrolase family 13 protein [Hungatella sp.]